MFGLGSEELIVILVIFILLFGGKKLPELSKGIGEAIREIRKGFTEDTDEKEKESKKDEPKNEEHHDEHKHVGHKNTK